MHLESATAEVYEDIGQKLIRFFALGLKLGNLALEAVDVILIRHLDLSY